MFSGTCTEDILLDGSAAFRTKNVRSGGTAVLRLMAPDYTSADSISLTDSTGSAVNFILLKIPGEIVTEGNQALYLKFTVTGFGKQTYTATVGNDIYTAAVNIWKAAK